MPKASFWYEFASTYSYPAAMRISALASARQVEIVWRPFLLGPIFFEAGWRDSPFNLYPVKGRYMWRDIERICARLALPFARPDPFPQNSLLAARAAVFLDGAERAEFTRRLYLAEFGDRQNISDPHVVAGVANALGLDGPAIVAAAQQDSNKAKLKSASDEAKTAGLPGAPCLVTQDGEVFWGDDRLEQGLDWAIGKR